jgi:hypothetical protein
VATSVTLTIPAGTIIEGISNPSDPAWLVIEKGGSLSAVGTSSNPIIFTSDKAPSLRNPGDWGGIAIAGEAPVNKTTFVLSPTYTITGGGSNSASGSGTLEYARVEFAGAGYTTDPESLSAMLTFGAGTNTTIDHVQVANSKNDGIGNFGGTVNENFIVSYNARATDFQFSDGYVGKAQFLAAMNLDNSASPSVFSYGVNITNRIQSTSSATPITQPVLSNITVLGANYCNATTVNTNLLSAIHFGNNGTGKIYNSVFTSWNTSATPSGLLIDDPNSIAATSAGTLVFSYNSFDNAGSPAYSSGGTAWSGGCSTSMATWITSPGIPPCRQTGNQFSVTTLGYDAAFCDNFCGSGFSSNFVLGTTTLSAPVYTWDTGSAFSHVTYRGAFGSTDFTQSWANWCAQSTAYCL